MTITTTKNGPERNGASHYADITRPELEELYHYLANPETDFDIAIQDVAKEYGDKVAKLLIVLLDLDFNRKIW